MTMRPKTAEMLKQVEYGLFESDKYAPVRTALHTPPTNNDDEPEDIDNVLDRIEEFAPDMRNFVDSLLCPSVNKS